MVLTCAERSRVQGDGASVEARAPAFRSLPQPSSLPAKGVRHVRTMRAAAQHDAARGLRVLRGAGPGGGRPRERRGAGSGRTRRRVLAGERRRRGHSSGLALLARAVDPQVLLHAGGALAQGAPHCLAMSTPAGRKH